LKGILICGIHHHDHHHHVVVVVVVVERHYDACSQAD
jgi:hypothetical protein